MFVFDFPPNFLAGMEVVLERTGGQVGGYFGGAVLGADLTGDGRPELLVGAPLHSTPGGMEEGRVCVYGNMGRGQLSETPMVIAGDRAVRGRFGSALASVGDLDLDGYDGEFEMWFRALRRMFCEDLPRYWYSAQFCCGSLFSILLNGSTIFLC